MLPLYDTRVRSIHLRGSNNVLTRAHTRANLSGLLLDGTGIPEESFSVAKSLRTKKFQPPPIYIITGNQDGKVAHRQSLDVVSALKATASHVEYYEIEADHSFDKEPIYRMESLYNFFRTSARKD